MQKSSGTVGCVESVLGSSWEFAATNVGIAVLRVNGTSSQACVREVRVNMSVIGAYLLKSGCYDKETYHCQWQDLSLHLSIFLATIRIDAH